MSRATQRFVGRSLTSSRLGQQAASPGLHRRWWAIGPVAESFSRSRRSILLLLDSSSVLKEKCTRCAKACEREPKSFLEDAVIHWKTIIYAHFEKFKKFLSANECAIGCRRWSVFLLKNEACATANRPQAQHIASISRTNNGLLTVCGRIGTANQCGLMGRWCGFYRLADHWRDQKTAV